MEAYTLHPYVTLRWVCVCVCGGDCGCAEISVWSREASQNTNQQKTKLFRKPGWSLTDWRTTAQSVNLHPHPTPSPCIWQLASRLFGLWCTAEELFTHFGIQKPFRLCSDCPRSRYIQIVTKSGWDGSPLPQSIITLLKLTDHLPQGFIICSS